MLKVLIPYDGSECSKRALEDLQKAGLPEKAEAVVLTVVENWNGPAIYGEVSYPIGDQCDFFELSLEEAQSTAEEGARKLAKAFPHWSVDSEFFTDSAAEGIIRRIWEWKPDYVVMGSHGRSAAGRLLFGSVSHKVLTRAHCNLRISRSRGETEKKIPPLRVAVAYDGSQEAETAFETALCRRWPKGTVVRLITAVDGGLSEIFHRPKGPVRYWVREEDSDPAAWIARMLAFQKKRIEEKGLIAYAQAVRGEPKRTLLKETESWGADVIFAGCRGLTGGERIIAGSVSTALAMHAHCSVEVVHRLWDAACCCEEAGAERRDTMTRQPI